MSEPGTKKAFDVFSYGTLKEDEVLSESAIDHCRVMVSAELVSSDLFIQSARRSAFARASAGTCRLRRRRPGLGAGCTTRWGMAKADIDNKVLINRQYDHMMWPHNPVGLRVAHRSFGMHI